MIAFGSNDPRQAVVGFQVVRVVFGFCQKLSEAEAVQSGVAHRVYGFDFADIDRAVADDAAEGRAKLVVAPNGKLLGAALCGPRAWAPRKPKGDPHPHQKAAFRNYG